MSKVVLITGATSGIGESTARLMADSGYSLVLTGRNKEKLAALKAELEGDHLTLQSDVNNYQSVVEVMNQIQDKYGRLDVLVNNAGLGIFEPLEQAKIEDWHTMIDTNVKGLLNVLHATLHSLIENKGHVINLGSVASHHVFKNSGVYCATKWAVRAISESLRIELSSKINVTTISPGSVDTPFIEQTKDEGLLKEYRPNFASGIHPDQIALQIMQVIETVPEAIVSEVIIRPVKNR